MMDRHNTRRILIKILCLVLLSVLASCGQKGDLYLPDKNQASLPAHHTS